MIGSAVVPGLPKRCVMPSLLRSARKADRPVMRFMSRSPMGVARACDGAGLERGGRRQEGGGAFKRGRGNSAQRTGREAIVDARGAVVLVPVDGVAGRVRPRQHHVGGQRVLAARKIERYRAVRVYDIGAVEGVAVSVEAAGLAARIVLVLEPVADLRRL